MAEIHKPPITSQKALLFNAIVDKLNGKQVEVPNVDDGNVELGWLEAIANSVSSSSGGAVKEIVNMDSTKPISLRTLESGVYVLHGYFKPCEAVTQLVMAQVPLYASVANVGTMSYVQLFYSVNNSIQYLEITDETFVFDTVSLKQSTLKTKNKTIIGAINELYDLLNSA